MAGSPSEFLTFYRRMAMQPTLRQTRVTPSSRRTFVSTTTRFSSGGKLSTDSTVKTDQYPDSEHATNKKDKLDIQSANSAEGQKFVTSVVLYGCFDLCC